MVQLDLSPLAEAMVLRRRHPKIQMMTLASMESSLPNLRLQGLARAAAAAESSAAAGQVASGGFKATRMAYGLWLNARC